MANENDPKLPVSDLPLAFELNNDDKLPVTQGTEGHYIARNATASLIGDYIAKDKTFTELTTTNKKIIAAINEAATSGTEILSGTSAPTSSQGENGNLYIQYTEGVGGANDTVDALFSKLDGAWCAIDVGGAETLNDLTDVTITTPSNNDALMYNDDTDEWENKPIYLGDETNEGNIADVVIDTSEVSHGQVLMYDTGEEAWLNSDLVLSDLTNIYINYPPSDGQPLVYSSTRNKWENRSLYREITGTLTIGSTSVVLTNTYTDVTVANASLEVFTDTFGVNPTDITISGNNISLTFEAQSSTVNVKVRLWK